MNDKMMKKANIEYRTRNDECPGGQKLLNKFRHSSFVIRPSIFVVRNGLIAILFLALAILPSFSSAADNPGGRLTIHTVNYPLKYFAERIGGEHVKVVFPAPPVVDPAYWMPDRKTISDYQKADLILLNGAHYAKWTEKVTLPRSKMVNTSREFKDKYIKLNDAVTHSHGQKGEHAHEDVAFTIWLDFNLAIQQAKEIEKSLSRKKPELSGTFLENYNSLERDLMKLDREITEIVSRNQDLPLIVSHPVYDYLAGRYGFNVKSVHWEPDEVPAVDVWMELKTILKDHPARWMIWEGVPLKESAEKLTSMGVNSIVFDPCGNVPEKGDFLSVMRSNVDNLRSIFE